MSEDKIIDLGAARNKRDQPDPEHVRQDDFGRPMHEFCTQYEMDGGTWGGVTVWAYSWEDAESRVKAIRESLTLLGQLHSIIPA